MSKYMEWVKENLGSKSEVTQRAMFGEEEFYSDMDDYLSEQEKLAQERCRRLVGNGTQKEGGK